MLKSYIMERESTELLESVQKILTEGGMTLAVAESCTGGLISHYITSVPGSSAFFRAGIVAYSEDIKEGVLGVSADTIGRYGLVSAETAVEMAEKVRVLTKSDFSLSTTGNLGPDVLEEKERGLVYIAAVGKRKSISEELHLKGGRDDNKEAAALAALRLLLEFTEEELS
jgi:PncC family amidohydrolase